MQNNNSTYLIAVRMRGIDKMVGLVLKEWTS